MPATKLQAASLCSAQSTFVQISILSVTRKSSTHRSIPPLQPPPWQAHFKAFLAPSRPCVPVLLHSPFPYLQVSARSAMSTPAPLPPWACLSSFDNFLCDNGFSFNSSIVYNGTDGLQTTVPAVQTYSAVPFSTSPVTGTYDYLVAQTAIPDHAIVTQMVYGILVDQGATATYSGATTYTQS